MKVDGIEPPVLSNILYRENKGEVPVAEKAPPKGAEKQERGKPQLPSEESFREQLELGAARLNNTVRGFNLTLRFQIHRESERFMVQVVDCRTQEVIKEIPPERLLNVVAQIQTLIGLLLDEMR